MIEPVAMESQELNGRRVLVTGATGFIGGRLCRRLSEIGADVHALTRRSPPSHHVENTTWHRANLTDPAAIRAVVHSVAPDTVFHLAADVLGDPAPEQILPMLENNLLGTVNLLAAVDREGCRRMIATGSVVEPRDGEPPTSPYAASKAASTEHARMFHFLYGTPVVCLRLAMVYGPGQADAAKLIPHVIESLLRGEAPQLSSGLWEVDWVYVDDVVEALLLASVAEGAEGAVLDVGCGESASVRAVVENVARIIDSEAQPAFGALPDRPLQRSATLDLAPTRGHLGWVPKTTLEEGLRRAVDWHVSRALERPSK